jgi:glycosyltransferase involved in cell wall biosynthesis
MYTHLSEPTIPQSHHGASHEPARILHVFGCMNRGGAEMRTLELLRCLEPNLYRFEFCTLSRQGGELDDEIVRLGGKVHRVALNLAFPRKFLKLLRANSFSAVHSHVHYFSGFLLRLAATAGTPQRIAHFRSTSDGKGTNLWRRTRNFVLKRWIDKYATDILGVSRATLDSALGDGWQNDPRCSVIYSGIDCCSGDTQPDPNGVRNEFGLPIAAPLLIHVGRMTAEKNHERLIRVFAVFLRQVPNSYLLLVGAVKEPVNSRIRKQLDDFGVSDRVIVAGSRADVRRLLLAADLMVAPSLREGLPGAVLEAVAAGTPVLASDISPMIEVAEYLPIKTMSLLESDETWAAASVELCEDETLRTRLLEAFSQSPFTMPRSTAAYRKIYAVNGELQRDVRVRITGELSLRDPQAGGQ